MLAVNFKFSLILAILVAYASSLKFTPDRLLLPVIHNLQPNKVNAMDSNLSKILDCYSISLRHSGAMQAVETAASLKRKHVGVSSVSSSSDVSHLAHLGVDYISTRYPEESLVKAAVEENLPILTGVSSVEEAVKALQWGSTALKFYPSSAVPPRKIKAIINALKTTYGSQYIAKVPMIVAGGVTEADLSPYLSAGATGFAVGFNCEKSLEALQSNLEHFYRSAKIATWVTRDDLSQGTYIAEERNFLFL